MTLQEQLEKIENELKKNEERRKELLEKRKKILAAIELEEAQKEAENKKKIVDVIEENFGEISDENLEIFKKIMREQSDQMLRRKEQLEHTTE